MLQASNSRQSVHVNQAFTKKPRTGASCLMHAVLPVDLSLSCSGTWASRIYRPQPHMVLSGGCATFSIVGLSAMFEG